MVPWWSENKRLKIRDWCSSGRRTQPAWVTQLRHHATKQAVDLRFICHAISIDWAVWFCCFIHKSHQMLSVLRVLLCWIIAGTENAAEINIWELVVWRMLSIRGVNTAGLEREEGPGYSQGYVTFSRTLDLEPQKSSGTVSIIWAKTQWFRNMGHKFKM